MGKHTPVVQQGRLVAEWRGTDRTPGHQQRNRSRGIVSDGSLHLQPVGQLES